MKYFLSLFILSLLIPIFPAEASSECYQDPIYDLTGTAVIDSAAFVRSGACTNVTEILGTATAGERLPILMETDEWYLVEMTNGTKGWVWNGLMHTENIQNRVRIEYTDQIRSVTQTQSQTQTQTKAQEQTQTQTSGTSLRSRVRGWILLQVENHGEAWYVDPTSDRRFYMKDGPIAYEMMRKFGLGVTEADYESMLADDWQMKNRLRGRIILRVHKLGEAYYIHPETLALHYLKDGTEAYRLMRELSLGITNSDLSGVPSSEFVPISETSSTSPTSSTSSTSLSAFSIFQQGDLPSNLDLIAANEYWLNRVNALRAAKSLRQLVLDQRWVDTATEWASYMGENNEMSHNRPDGKSMHQWIDTKGLQWTQRYSQDGWDTNYFTENISWSYADNSQAGLEQAMDDALELFINEPPTGAHYRTVYHDDWNSVGVGFYFKPVGENRYKVYMAFHYGSLEL